MAVDYTEAFEDYGKRILMINTIELWRSTESPDLDELFQEEVVLAGESTAFQSPEHALLIQQVSQDYTSFRQALDAAANRAWQTARDKTLRGTMLKYLRLNGTAPYTGTDTTAALQCLRDSMEIDSQTVDANAVSVGTVTYEQADNGGDWDNTDAWAAKATIAVNGSHAQLIRSAACVLVCTSAGYAVQGAETFALSGVFLDTSEEFSSPTEFVVGDHSTGEQTEDVDLDSTGQQVPGSGTRRYTGIKVTLHNIAINDISETGDGVALGVSAYDVDVHTVGKTPFNRNNVTFAGASGSRNGTVYLRAAYLAGIVSFTLYKDSGLTIPLSDTVTHDTGGADATKTLVVAASAADLFDGLVAGDSIISFLADSSNLLAFAASYTITLGVPLPIGEGDTVLFTLTSGGEGVIQSHFVRFYNFYLPSNAAGGETIPDSLAE